MEFNIYTSPYNAETLSQCSRLVKSLRIILHTRIRINVSRKEQLISHIRKIRNCRESWASHAADVNIFHFATCLNVFWSLWKHVTCFHHILVKFVHKQPSTIKNRTFNVIVVEVLIDGLYNFSFSIRFGIQVFFLRNQDNIVYIPLQPKQFNFVLPGFTYFRLQPRIIRIVLL